MQNSDEIIACLEILFNNKEYYMWRFVSELGNLEDEDLFLTTKSLSGNSSGDRFKDMEILRQWGKENKDYLGRHVTDDIKYSIFVEAVARSRRRVSSFLNSITN